MRMTRHDRTRVRELVADAVVDRHSVTTGELSRLIRERTSFDYAGPAVAALLKQHGFIRMRQGVYAKAAASRA